MVAIRIQDILWSLGWLLAGLVALIGLLTGVTIVWHRLWLRRQRRRQNNQSTKVVAFFHPFCSAGGGGERVLFRILYLLLKKDDEKNEYDNLRIVLYTVDPPSPTYARDLWQRQAQERFCLPALSAKELQKLSYVHLPDQADLLRSHQFRFLSLFRELLSSMMFCYRALCRSTSSSTTSLQNNAPMVPNVFIDTMGSAFCYLPAKLLWGCQVVAYVHYPTISTDMLWNRASDLLRLSSSPTRVVRTSVQLVYWTGLAALYGLVGSTCVDCACANSTWTLRHMQSLWKGAAWRRRIFLVYPPVLIPGEESTTTTTAERSHYILSIGQFRPEKNHALQLKVLARLLQQYPQHEKEPVQLVLVGSCRQGSADQDRLQQLQQLARDLEMEQNVQFIVNQPFAVVQEWMQKASVGIHTMWNEHFGIGIVEMMAAGLIVVAHDSGGPKSDIMVPLLVNKPDGQQKEEPVGFLASSMDAYAETLHQIFTLDASEEQKLRANAQIAASRFSDDVFDTSFRNALEQAKILPPPL